MADLFGYFDDRLFADFDWQEFFGLIATFFLVK